MIHSRYVHFLPVDPKCAKTYNVVLFVPQQVDLSSLNLVLVKLELFLSAYVAYRSQRLCMPKRLIEEIDSTPEPPPRCPTGRLKLHVRVPNLRVQETITSRSSAGVRVGTSPAMKTEGTRYVPLVNTLLVDRKPLIEEINPQPAATVTAIPLDDPLSSTVNLRKRCDMISGSSSSISNSSTPSNRFSAGHVAQIVQTSTGRQLILTPSSSNSTTLMTTSGQRLTVVNRISTPSAANAVGSITQTKVAASSSNQNVPLTASPISSTLATSIVQQLRHHSYSSTAAASLTQEELEQKIRTEFYLASVEESRKERRTQILELLGRMNQKRCDAVPMYGEDLRESVAETLIEGFADVDSVPIISVGPHYCQKVWRNASWSLAKAIKSIEQRAEEFRSVFNNFVIYVPAVRAPAPSIHVSHPYPSRANEEQDMDEAIQERLKPALKILHPIISAMSTQVSEV